MKPSRSIKHATLGLLCSACIPAGHVFAQGAETDQSTQSSEDAPSYFQLVEEVVVTARKREESLKDVPISVEAKSGADLFNAGYDNLQDLVAEFSNVFISTDSTARSQVSVRGIGPDTTGVQGPGIGFFIDGVYQFSTGQLTIPFFDLERVEVLKGPQGTLYGRNSLGGVINYITPKPDGEFNASIAADLGSFDTHGVAAAVGGTLVEDTLFGRLSVQRRQSDGPYINRETGDPAYPLDSEQIRARFVWNALDMLELDLTAEHSQVNGTSFIYTQLGTEDGALQNNLIDNYRSDPPSETNIDTQQYSLVSTMAFDYFDLRSQTTYFEQDYPEFELDGDTGPANRIRLSNPRDIDSVSQEFRLLSTDDGPIQWLLGVEYARLRINSDISTFGPFLEDQFLPLIPGALSLTGTSLDVVSQEERELWATFVDVTYTLTDRVELGFGLRYDDVVSTQDAVSTTVTGVADFGAGPTPLPDAVVVRPRAKIEQEEWQPKATVTVDWTDNLTQFAVVSKGFREGGFNAAAAGSAQESWQGDIAWNYETGMRWEDDSGRFAVNGALFYIDWQDITGSVFLADGVTTAVLNLGDATSQGAEIEGVFGVTENVTLTASTAYLDCEYDEVKLQDGFVAPGIFEGNQCIYTSKWSFRTAADVIYPISGTEWDLTASASVVGRKDTTVGLDATPNTQNTVQEEYYVTNLSIGIKGDIYTLALFGDNIFDERYATAASSLDLGPGIFQSYTATLGQPETYGLRFRVDF